MSIVVRTYIYICIHTYYTYVLVYSYWVGLTIGWSNVQSAHPMFNVKINVGRVAQSGQKN